MVSASLIIGIISLVISVLVLIYCIFNESHNGIELVNVCTKEYQDSPIIDGINLNYGDRILVTNGHQRGIYIKNEDGFSKLPLLLRSGTMIFVQHGLIYHDQYVMCIRKDGVLLFRLLMDQLLGDAPLNNAMLVRDKERIRWIPTNTFTHNIPNIIHHIYGLWDDGPLPTEYTKNRELWHQTYLNYEMKLWLKQDCELLIEKYPQYKNLWNNFPHKCQKSDFIRYLILYDQGGWYMDLDCIPVSSLLESYKYNEDVVLFTEIIITPEEANKMSKQRIRNNKPEHTVRVANYAIGSSKNNSSTFWEQVFNEIQLRSHEQVLSDYDVIYTTGPDVITTIYHDYQLGWLIDKNDSDRTLTHLCAGKWRYHNK